MIPFKVPGLWMRSCRIRSIKLMTPPAFTTHSSVPNRLRGSSAPSNPKMLGVLPMGTSRCSQVREDELTLHGSQPVNGEAVRLSYGTYCHFGREPGRGEAGSKSSWDKICHGGWDKNGPDSRFL